MAPECPGDDSFGPSLSDLNCRDFDFTLFFEQSILGILPALLFAVAVPARFAFLARRKHKTTAGPARLAKLVVALVLCCVQLSLLVLWSIEKASQTRVSVASAVINLVVAIQIVGLTWVEDAKSVSPSSLLNTYLLFTVLFDAAQARTLWLRRSTGISLAAAFTTGIAVKTLLLLLEAQGKRRYLKTEYQGLPPESTSGLISRSFLWWINQLFRKGLRSLLTYEDLYVLDQRLASAGLGDAITRAWNQRRKPERRFEFPRAVWRALWKPFLAAVFPRLCLIGFTFAQPFLIFRVLSHLTRPGGETTLREGYGLIGAAALIYLGLAVSSLHYNQNIYRFTTMFRGATVALIYDHTLVIQDHVYDEAAAVTLMSTDVDNIARCLVNLNECWARLLEVVIGVTLLTLQLGWVSVVPVAVVFLSFLGATQISKVIGGRQRIWVEAVQKRIAITSSALAEIRSVKMMGLSSLLSSIIQAQRVEETHRMAGFRWCNIWQNVVQNIPYIVAPVLTFTIYAVQAMAQGKESVNTAQAFTSLAIISLLTDPTAKLLSAIPSTASTLGCFDRIQKFLTSSERQDRRQTSPDIPPGATDTEQQPAPAPAAAITVDQVDLRPYSSPDVLLQGVSFAIPRGSISMVIGAVGSGKTTLLRAILGEVVPERGLITVCSRRIAYCSQTPWLPNLTIRQAICGPMDTSSDYDEEWYQATLNACDLDRDLASLNEGDQTQIGSGNTVLSGGQKHRIALARALYARAEMILLDDVLGALDSKTKHTVTDRVFGEAGLLRRLNTTCLLATHSVECLNYADRILILSDGRVKHDVTYGQAVRDGLVKAFLREDENVDIPSEEDARVNRKEEASGVTPNNEVRDLTRATGDFEVYRYYFRFVGWLYMGLFVGSVLLNVLGETFSSILLKWWTDEDGQRIVLYTSVYLSLALLTVVGLFGYNWSMSVLITPSTARSFHAVLLNTVMRAPQSFFSKTDTGNILNRFSQDMALIESQLPTGVLVTISNFFMSLASVALVAAGSSYMAISVPFLFVAIFVLQDVYLRTSRQLRLLDLEARSPLYTHFLESLGGLATIRAFQWDRRFREENHRLLDHSQRPHYLLYCIQRWLSLVLELIVGAEAVLVVALAVNLRSSTAPGLLGISLNNILSLSGNLSSLVSGWTLFETSLGAIARLKSFEAGVKPEDKVEENHQPPSDWPGYGGIEFRDVTASHGPTATALRDVNFRITPGQKIGVCGRTGSGKSSLVATLLRLLEIDSGTILVDGLDLATIPRETIRERIVAIPQDPLIIANMSLRLNVDPSATNPDAALIGALQRVGLWDGLLSDRPGGLEADITTASLSKGQQQLLALARALVLKEEKKIVLLDEATSNVDGETDAVMQRVVREEFTECTVITVAHRLDTIMGSDVILVMENGRIVETGPPGVLLRKDEGRGEFARLVRG
ncbi:putative ATP-binding cassette transporter [Cercophora newfieldiana]|uniref:ATP-binding cassette transporter n=1 Tax=Cercophora newfieldiana TaxID=92897 RepID=A0AA39Y079_9PEZI|nr:putative ATP-binding cassette transporter [Cercophora newfieldiana]